MNIETPLEKQLLGAIGGFIAMCSEQPSIAADVFRAAELDQKAIEQTLQGDASDRFNCTMWNLCNHMVGMPMLSHADIMQKRLESRGTAGAEP